MSVVVINININKPQHNSCSHVNISLNEWMYVCVRYFYEWENIVRFTVVCRKNIDIKNAYNCNVSHFSWHSWSHVPTLQWQLLDTPRQQPLGNVRHPTNSCTSRIVPIDLDIPSRTVLAIMLLVSLQAMWASSVCHTLWHPTRRTALINAANCTYLL